MYIQDASAFTLAEKVILSGLTGLEPTQQKTVGMIAGTLVETSAGWTKVETLGVGDRLFTYDGALRQIEQIERAYFRSADLAAEGLVHIPGGVLNNCTDLSVLPDQPLLIEDLAVEEICGKPSILIAASALIGHRGISRRQPTGHIETIRPVFSNEEVVWANTGSLFHCPAEQAGSDFFTQASATTAQAILTRMDLNTLVAA